MSDQATEATEATLKSLLEALVHVQALAATCPSYAARNIEADIRSATQKLQIAIQG